MTAVYTLYGSASVASNRLRGSIRYRSVGTPLPTDPVALSIELFETGVVPPAASVDLCGMPMAPAQRALRQSNGNALLDIDLMHMWNFGSDAAGTYDVLAVVRAVDPDGSVTQLAHKKLATWVHP